QYDSASNSWRFVNFMLQTRTGAGAASLGGLVYVCGGVDRDSMERFDPKQNQWTLLTATLPMRSAGLALVALGDCLYAIAGNREFGNFKNQVHCYNLYEGTWTESVPLLSPCSCPSATVIRLVADEYIYVFGGDARAGISVHVPMNRLMSQAIQRWKPGMTTWELCRGTLRAPIKAMACCTVSGCDLIEPLLSR
uniref:Kelch-like 34 n=1 Tax=Macrostomum lignano TaxID=282301 RepID=A0A1I8I754_9PLAT